MYMELGQEYFTVCCTQMGEYNAWCVIVVSLLSLQFCCVNVHILQAAELSVYVVWFYNCAVCGLFALFRSVKT